jgi:putative uridylyltransferase
MSQMGCVILAGGLGTRLGLKGPKGCVKVRGEETLFEILLSKMKGPVAIMTSPLNREETERFLKAHDFFGVKEISFFDQDLRDGYPDGNGKVFKKLVEGGLWDLWHEKGIREVGFIPIDNPLAEIEDLCPERAEVVIRCVKIESPEEKIGRMVFKESKVFVGEYSEMEEVTELGYTGQFSATMEFVKRVSGIQLPWHKIEKQGEVRYENFIFDAFPYAESHRIVISERERYFAPVKDSWSLEKVRRRWVL